MHPSATISTMNSEIPTNGAAGTSTIDRGSVLRSPMALSGNLGASTLSMRQKAARKRRINAHHNSNFHAGYVPVEEDALHRTGIRGRKRYFLYCLVATMLLVTFLNIAMTAWLLHILGMTHYGLSSLEFISLGGRDFMRVFTDAHISTLTMNEAPLGARFNSSLELRTEDAELEIKAISNRNNTSLKLEGQNLTMSTKDFCVKTQGSNRWISANLQFLAHENIIQNFFTEKVTVGKIHGVKDFSDKDLYIENVRNDTIFSGLKEVSMHTSKDIVVKARSAVLEAEQSINIQADKILLGTQVPVVKSRKRSDRKIKTFKICVCANSGRVFAVQARRPRVSCREGAQLEETCGS